MQRSPSERDPAVGHEGDVPAVVQEVLRGAGQPLSTAERTFMEDRFGRDFSRVRSRVRPTADGLVVGPSGDHHEHEAEQVSHAVANQLGGDDTAASHPHEAPDFRSVRVHTGGRAAEAAAAVNAQAFTVGHQIVFGAAHQRMESLAGRQLLAHELTHVIQQDAAPSRTLQRQEADDLPRPGRLPTPEPDDQDVLITRDIPGTVEPACPRPPTGLGHLEPVPACPADLPERDGDHFKFCRDSDVFSAGERTRLLSAVSALDSRTTFEVHGYASLDAPGRTDAERQTYNEHLSCHRAKRAARELVNAGVGEDRIDIAAHGGTERFGPGSTNPENRAVVIHHLTPARQAAPAISLSERPSTAELQVVADAAAARLVRGEYQLGADAYVARWTCGHFRSLSEIVERATVVIDPTATEQGHISPVGVNTVRVSPEIGRTDDPLECAANRIADLAFHHAVRPQMHSFSDQHAAALHMLSLAGLRKCHVAQPPLFAHDFSVPSTVDPQAGQQPLCADDPLPGALTPQRQRSGQAAPPTFTLVDLNVPGNGGGLDVVPVGTTPLMEANPDDGFTVSSTVNVSGDPREIAKYEVGIVQTVLSENFEVRYFGGQRIRSRMPLPMRDGPRQGHARSAPPWFDVDAHTRAASGNVSVGMTDMPNMLLFRAFVDLNKARFFSQHQVPPVPGRPGDSINRPDFDPHDHTVSPRRAPDVRNAPDRGHRVVHFNTWVMARQVNPPAPLSRFSSIFIAGKRITFRINANFTGDAIHPRGQGSWSVSSSDATAADQETVRLRGATPADFTGPPILFNQFLVSEDAPPIDRAGGISSTSQLNAAVRQVVTPHRQRLGITQPVLVRIKWDAATGRVIMDHATLPAGAVRVESVSSAPPVSAADAAMLARAIFPEIRKIVIGQLGQSASTGVLTLNFAQPQL